jgi:hypothetical protein
MFKRRPGRERDNHLSRCHEHSRNCDSTRVANSNVLRTPFARTPPRRHGRATASNQIAPKDQKPPPATSPTASATPPLPREMPRPNRPKRVRYFSGAIAGGGRVA